MNNHLSRPDIIHGDELRDSAISLIEQCYSDDKYEMSVMIENNVMKILKGSEWGKCANSRFKK